MLDNKLGKKMTLVELKNFLRGLNLTFFYDRNLDLWTLVQDSGTSYFTKTTILNMGKEKFINTYLK